MDVRKNIVLIGMPSCGKSVTGVVLAKALKMKFVDTDLLIQEEAGKGLQEIINEDGIEAFKKIEEKVLGSVELDNAVIATGGSAVYGKRAMEHFKQIGTVIFLDVPVEDIYDRVGSLKERGVVSNGKNGIEEIFADRNRLYHKYADIIYTQKNNMLRESVEELYAIIKNKIER